jgi:hypothetical protein
MNLRRAAATAAALALLPLASACGNDGDGKQNAANDSVDDCKTALQGQYEKAAADGPATENPKECKGLTDGEVADLAQEVLKDNLGDDYVEGDQAEAEPAASDTELSLGDTFSYEDDVNVTVDSIEKITQFGEYDTRPSAGETAFWVNVTIDNGSKKPLNLDDFILTAQGATNGGEVMDTYLEKGAKDMTGRLAPGIKTQKNSAYIIDDKYGKSIVVSVGRYSDDFETLLEDPNWTGDIK